MPRIAFSDNPRLRMAFADNLKYYLAERHISQKALAKAVKRSATAVSLWLAGTTTPPLSTVMTVANVLGVTVNDLLEEPPKGRKTKGNVEILGNGNNAAVADQP